MMYMSYLNFKGISIVTSFAMENVSFTFKFLKSKSMLANHISKPNVLSVLVAREKVLGLKLLGLSSKSQQKLALKFGKQF